MRKLIFYGRICLLIFMANQVFAQTNESEKDDLLSHSYQDAIRQYEDFIGFSSQIYNGDEYVDYDRRINGYPCFDAEYYSVGQIVYNDMLFDSVDLKYDVYKQVVVIEYYDHKGYSKDIILANDRIEKFSYLDHNFIRIDDELLERSEMDDGFYEMLYDEQTTVVSKRIKLYNEVIEDRKIKKEFITKDRFYVLFNDQYNFVKNKRSVLKLLVDKKKEIKKYIKQNDLNLRHNFENSLLSVVQYYDTLTN